MLLRRFRSGRENGIPSTIAVVFPPGLKMVTFICFFISIKNPDAKIGDMQPNVPTVRGGTLGHVKMMIDNNRVFHRGNTLI